MNRRQYPRLEIDRPAAIEYEGRRYTACRMLNFSRGGAYLQCDDEGLKAVLPDGYANREERPEALLSVSGEALSVPVYVVYCRNNGLGLAFSDAAGRELFEALRAGARSKGQATAAASKKSLNPAQLHGVVEQFKAQTRDFLDANLPNFFLRAQQDLQRLIAETNDRDEESHLFFALNSLEQDQADLIRRFVQLTEHGFSRLVGQAPGDESEELDQPGELELVETQEIDAWILVNDAARQVETDVARPLYQIEVAFSYLFQGNIHNELNPLSPISLLTSFKRVLDDYEFDIPLLKVLLSAFRKTLLSRLDELFDALLQLLQRQRIDGLEHEFDGHWTIVKAPEPGAVSSGPIGHITTLSQLQSVGDEQSAMTQAERQEVLTSLASLSRLQAATLQQQIERLLEQASARPVKLSPEARSAIGAGEELVTMLSKDPLITPELRALLGSLKFLIIESVLQDTSLLDNPEHPVRLLLDSIESLKPYVNTGPRASLLRDREARRLAAVAEAVEKTQFDHVDEVTREIQALQREQRERFEHNRRLAISRCLKDEKLRQAQLSTFEALRQLLRKQPVPMAVDRLLRLGWVNLLVQTAVLEKTRGKQWQAYLQVVELLSRIFTRGQERPKLEADQRQALLALIRKGFTNYPIHAEEMQAFEQTLRQRLSGDAGGEQASEERFIEFDEAYLKDFFHGMQRSGESVQQADIDPAWMKRVDEIPLDTWLVESIDPARSRVLSLAWKNPVSGRYLLVDGNGFKVLDEEQSTLASRFANGQVVPMELPEQPIVERTIESILSSSYDGFKVESSIDPLTGLSNRRAFEVALGKRLGQRAGDETNVLLLIDLDKFQVVNDLCGFEGGDRLLQTVTDILLSYLPTEGFLARIGDDEFSLLLPGHNLEQGYQTAELLRVAIDEYDFEWRGRMIPASASVGIVQIEATEQTPGELMQASLAACSMAKQGGGNCTRIYLASDSAYQDRQQLVQSLPAIKEALTKGRMELFVQPIVPLQASGELSLHHEVLLRIRNAAGELESPQEFVLAAEQYDLMRAVDRWVVEAFFTLLEPFADRLSQAHSFSINLSAKSIGDGEFRRFLTERISSSRLATRHLGFEITETALVGDISDTAAFIQEIRRLGCSFSLDDFGSGYASFSYLKDFPVDFVKIDGVFVREILNKPADYAMINSITEIAHFMDKRVIAEFVADAQTGEVLQSMGVDYAQGYHFGKPRALKTVLSEIIAQAPEPHSGRA